MKRKEKRYAASRLNLKNARWVGIWGRFEN